MPTVDPTALLPRGAWPVMLTPFHDDRSIDWEHVDAYTDWLIDCGAAGIFTVALSSEMYDLTREERLALARRVVKRAAGRVPVVASCTQNGEAARQVDAVAEMAATGVGAVILISSLVATLEDTESKWLSNAETILNGTPGVRLGIYECPLPYKRLPSIDALKWMANSWRFVFFKDTSQSVTLMGARIKAIEGTPLQLYNAQISSLTETLKVGAAGFSGYAANIYPDLVGWLCGHFADEPNAKAAEVQRLLTIAEHVINARYPSSAKYFLTHSSRLSWNPISRWRPESIGAHEGKPLVEFAAYLRGLELPFSPRR